MLSTGGDRLSVMTWQLFSALVRTSPTLLPLLTAGPGHRVESQSACGIEVLNLSNCCLQTTGIVAFGSTLQVRRTADFDCTSSALVSHSSGIEESLT